MGRSRRLLLVAGLLAALLPAVVAAVGPQPGAPCEPTLLAAQVALFCAPGMATALCCKPVVDAVDLGVPCLCRVAAEPQLVTAGLDVTHLVKTYGSCGGLLPGVAHLSSAACEGPAPPGAVVSSLRPPAPASPAPRRTHTAHDAPPPPPSSEKPSSPLPVREHDGAAPHAKVAPAQPCTSPLAPAAATAPPPLPRHSAAASSKAAFIFVATAMRPTPPAAAVSSRPPPSRTKQPGAPSPSPSSETPSSPDGVGVALIFGYIFTGALYLSPIPTIWHICRVGNVGHYKVDMFLVTLIRCIVWTFYGLPDPIRWPFVIINAVGVGIQVAYLVLFLLYSPPEGKVRLVIWLVVIAGLSFVAAAGFFSLLKDPRLPLGILGDVASVVMYAGPIRQLISVWQTNDARNMSILVAVFSLLNGICLTTNGFLVQPRDVFVIVSSCAGIVSGTCQVVLWVKVKFFG